MSNLFKKSLCALLAMTLLLSSAALTEVLPATDEAAVEAMEPVEDAVVDDAAEEEIFAQAVEEIVGEEDAIDLGDCIEPDESGNADPGSADESGNADPDNADESGNADPSSADESGNADPDKADESGNADPSSADESGNADPDKADESGNADPGSTDESGNADPDNADEPVLIAQSDNEELELGADEEEAEEEMPQDAEPEEEESEENVYEMLVDSDALFDGYVKGMFGLGKNKLFEARNTGGDLYGEKAELYTFLRSCFADIAAGRRASTACTSSVGRHLNGNDIWDVISRLMADCPYEMFWYANTYRWIRTRSKLTVKFSVGLPYAAGALDRDGHYYMVNTAALSRVRTAAANARAVVSQNASKSDYNKLVAYRNYICNAVSYNNSAFSGRWDSRRKDPWQLIWVFDGDRSTNVVCEGYAEAFQYLCDMTTFRGNVMCYCVTGTGNGGAHKWNIVHMPNGRNYHVDITWCDQPQTGTYDWYFMKAPISGTAGRSYRFSVSNGNYRGTGTYAYDSVTLSTFRSSDLVISSRSYGQEATLPVVSMPLPRLKVTSARVSSTVHLGKPFMLDLNGLTARSFKSSKIKVATVNAVGVVTPKAVGKTKITIKIGKAKRTVTLRVIDPTIPTRVSLNMSGTVAARAGTSLTLKAILPPGTYSGIKWKSSNKKVAVVSGGVVTFRKKGKVTITATTIRGKKKAKVKFRVTP